MAEPKLTPKQKQFVAEYLKDLNAAGAAVRAGYSAKSSDTIASQLLRKKQVARAIEKAKAKRLEKAEVDAQYVLKRLVEIDTLDVADILDNTGNMLPIRQWPEAWRRSITGIDLQEIMSGDTESVIRKLTSSPA